MMGQLQRQSGRGEALLGTDHSLPEALLQALDRRPGRKLSSSFSERKERPCECGLESDPGETQQVPQSSHRSPADAAGTSRPRGGTGTEPLTLLAAFPPSALLFQLHRAGLPAIVLGSLSVILGPLRKEQNS